MPVLVESMLNLRDVRESCTGKVGFELNIRHLFEQETDVFAILRIHPHHLGEDQVTHIRTVELKVLQPFQFDRLQSGGPVRGKSTDHPQKDG